MRKNIMLLLLSFFVVSCSINTEKEQQLQKDLRNFIIIRNDGDILSLINYSHPKIVRHYKNLGDSVLIHEFKNFSIESVGSDTLIYWNRSKVTGIKAKGTNIQSRIEIELIQKSRKLDSSVIVYGFTDKELSNWLFALEKDYFTIISPEIRLFTD
ncbi:MAG: hypothetical protein WC994_03850 [Brumimicrobium sp.]